MNMLTIWQPMWAKQKPHSHSTLQAPAPAANIVLMNKDTKEVLATVPAGDVKEGANSAVIANEQLPEGELAWGVEIANQNAARPNMVASVPGFAKLASCHRQHSNKPVLRQHLRCKLHSQRQVCQGCLHP